jgi:ankyrin repeat protein
MFKWIVCAREPIHLEELREAVAFTLEDLAYDSEKLPTDLNRLIRACGNLVVADEETQVIQLAHHTVQQYLLQQDGSPFQFTIRDANVMAGEFCVAYLSFADFESQVTRYAENKNTDMFALGKIASRGPLLQSDHPGQKIVRVLNTLRGPRSNGLEIGMTLYVPPQKTVWQPTNFTFLSYIVSHWLWHTIFFSIGDDANDGQETRRDMLFKSLILRKQLLFDFRPWGDFNRDVREISSISLVGWALMANHRYLIQMASSDIALPSPVNLWQATSTKYSWEATSAKYSPREVYRNSWEPTATSGLINPYHLNIMDLDYDPSNTSNSPGLVWLFSRLSWACRKGHLDVVKEFRVRYFANAKDAYSSLLDHFDCIIKYLLVAAAACGELQVVKYLWDQTIVPYRAFSVVSDLTKGFALVAIEHAAISGHFLVVDYLAVQGARPGRPGGIFTVPGLFQQFFDQAICENNSGTMKSLLFLRTLIAKSNMGDLYPELTAIDRKLSNTLIEAITNGRTKVVRLMLKLGTDPNGPNQAGSTPLIEAIRHSRDSIVSMLLEYDCSLGNTSAGMPLTVAACVGNLSAVRELILHGAEMFGEPSESENLMAMAYTDNSFTDPGGSGHQASRSRVYLSPTPLYMACYHGNLDIVKLLLHYGAASNFPSPATIIRMTQRVASSAILDYELDCYLNEILTDSFSNRESVVIDTVNWELPITVAMARGNEDIINILLSSGALRPEEFDCLYGSCLGWLDSQLENLANHVIHSLVSGPLLPKNETSEAHITEKTGGIRTRMMEMGMPTATANRIHSLAELQSATAVTTASEQQILKLQQERNRRRVEYVVQKSNTSLDSKAACLIEAARNYRVDRDDLLIEALVHDGASLTIHDKNGTCVPYNEFVDAARWGNLTLRHALLELGVAAAVSFVDGTPNGRNPCGHEELERRYSSLEQIVRSTALRIYHYPRTINKIHSYCEILTFGVYNNDMSFTQRLYENLMFPSPKFPPWAELCAVVDHGESKLVELLCRLGGNVHSRDYNGATPLMVAAERGVKDVIEVLLDLGANPTHVDHAGENALYKAAIGNKRDAITSLIRAKNALPNSRLDAELALDALDTALALCVSNGKPDAWRNLATAFRYRDPIFSETVTPLYDQARGLHLLRGPCHHVQGLFELSAVQDENKVPFQMVSPVEDVEEPKGSRGLSKAAAALLEAGTCGDALLGFIHEFESLDAFFYT